MSGSASGGKGFYSVRPASAALLAVAGLTDARSVYEHPEIRVWRKLSDRENATLDTHSPEGTPVRLHIKRVSPKAAVAEAEGITMLESAGIPTVPLAAVGDTGDGRGLIITVDLNGYDPCDKLVGSGVQFAWLLEPTARLAAHLHNAGLHHRDLYLCHFMADARLLATSQEHPVDLALIDAARVRRLPTFFRKRWIVKDLSQFWYSTTSLDVTGDQREQWLEVYARLCGRTVSSLRGPVLRKGRSIARHDRALREAQPGRNISIPGGRA